MEEDKSGQEEKFSSYQDRSYLDRPYGNADTVLERIYQARPYEKGDSLFSPRTFRKTNSSFFVD
jgi:hypothetical protein